MQCCGEPFQTGGHVEWTAVKWVYDIPPGLENERIDYYYENHADAEQEVFRISGVVAKIQAVYQKYDLDGSVYRPVAAKLVDFDREAGGWEADHGEDRFSAYLVELQQVEVTIY